MCVCEFVCVCAHVCVKSVNQKVVGSMSGNATFFLEHVALLTLFRDLVITRVASMVT